MVFYEDSLIKFKRKMEWRILITLDLILGVQGFNILDRNGWNWPEDPE